MIDLNVTFFVQLINFLVFLFILNSILVKPLMGMVERRERLMAESKASVQGADELAARKEAEYEEALAKTRQEARELYEQLRAQGLKEQEQQMESARSEAREILDAGEREISEQTAAARAELERCASDLSRDIVAKVLGRAS